MLLGFMPIYNTTGSQRNMQHTVVKYFASQVCRAARTGCLSLFFGPLVRMLGSRYSVCCCAAELVTCGCGDDSPACADAFDRLLVADTLASSLLGPPWQSTRGSSSEILPSGGPRSAGRATPPFSSETGECLGCCIVPVQSILAKPRQPRQSGLY